LGLFDIEDPAGVDVLGVEEHLNVDLGGVPFTGTLDRVERLPNGHIRVTDYKTGKARSAADAKRFGHDAEGDQVRLYAAAYEAKYGRRPRQGALLYTRAGKSRKVAVTRPQVAKTVAGFT